MPSSPFRRPDCMPDLSTFPAFDDSDNMLFGDIEIDDKAAPPFSAWEDVPSDDSKQFFSPMLSSLSMNFDFSNPSQTSPTESYYGSAGFYTPEDLQHSPNYDSNDMYSRAWLEMSPSSPISIQSNQLDTSFNPFLESIPFNTDGTFSPTEFAAMHPLPASVSPSSSFEDHTAFQRQRVNSISPMDTTGPTPNWAHIFDVPPPSTHVRSPSSPLRRSPLGDSTVRRSPLRRDSMHVAQVFQSSSAPSSSPNLTRSYSRRAESVSVSDDRDATVRRKRKISAPGDMEVAKDENPPLKSVLRPPKLAPSAWQLYFTDWISRHQATSTRKLNVAQAAKEAGQEYSYLSTEEKEPYKRRSQAMKESRERELAIYMHSLTPDDIKRENAFRTQQRKAGKSRKSNIKDPNAPKKPLSAYFMFLQRIRANPGMVHEIFGSETETTKQSVLAAAKWRSMTDDERKPFLAQAEQEKMEYEAARRLYEEGTTGFENSINFSILPGSPAFRTMKMESESESDGLSGDDAFERYIKSS